MSPPRRERLPHGRGRALLYVPAEWLDLVPEELCVDEAPFRFRGCVVFCDLTPGHGGRHYNRDVKRFW